MWSPIVVASLLFVSGDAVGVMHTRFNLFVGEIFLTVFLCVVVMRYACFSRSGIGHGGHYRGDGYLGDSHSPYSFGLWSPLVLLLRGRSVWYAFRLSGRSRGISPL